MDGEIGQGAEVVVDSASWRAAVGQRLRSERLRRGLEVADVAERLKLRTSFVAAVEDGRGHELMDEAYEWSHIKSIAGVLDLELEGRR